MPIVDVKAKDMAVYDRQSQVKLKHSAFGFTMNTNYRPKTSDEILEMDRQYTDVMERALKDNDGELLRRSLKVVDSIQHDGGKKTFDTHPMTSAEFDENVKKIKVRYRNEVGTNFKYGGRFHTHGYIYVIHTTMVHLDIEVMMDGINTYLEALDLPTFKYGHVGMEKISMKEYMSKQDLLNQSS